MAVGEVRLAAGDGFLVIESDHISLPNQPAAIDAVLRFLEGRNCAGQGLG